MPDQLRPDTEAALRGVAEQMAVRMILAHCVAAIARTAPDPTKALETTKAELLDQAHKFDQLAGDTNNIIPTVCAAVIASVFNNAAQHAR
jgi:hypothetical protein